VKIKRINLLDESAFATGSGLWTGKKGPFVSATVIRNTNFTASGRVDYSDVAVLQVEEKQLASRRLDLGDIIIERSGGGPSQPVGRVVFFDREDRIFSHSNFTSRLRVLDTDRLEPRFVFYYLLYFHDSGQTDHLQRRTTGIRNLDWRAYRETAGVPLFDLDEQRQIAAVLSAVQRAIGRQERLIALTAELKKGLMHKLLTEGTRGESLMQTEIGPVPETWTENFLGTVARFSSGGTPSREVSEYWAGGTIPWVKTTEVNYYTITETEERITQAGLNNSSAKIFPVGTLLMAMYGQGLTRGRVGTLGIAAATNQACAAIMPHSEEEVSTGFLYHFLEFHYENLRQRGHGANQTNLSMTLLKQFPVYYPKHREQQAIIAVLRAVDEKRAIHERERIALTALFRALLHQLMTAQIRVQDLDLSALEEAEQEPVGAV
jgi:type I restriction enzyme S subunit